MQRYIPHLFTLLALAALALLAPGLGRAAAPPAALGGTPGYLPLISVAGTATPLPNGGIQTKLFYMHQTTGTVDENLFFTFEVKNISDSTITYGILAAHTDQGVTADSWHAPLTPGEDLTWDDHINFPNPGTYQVYLGICYASHDDCKTGGAPWTHLSDDVTVTSQLPVTATSQLTATPTQAAP